MTPGVVATGVIRETGGAAELPETLEATGNLHRPLVEKESLSNDLLLTSEDSEVPQLQKTVDVGERPHQEEIMDQLVEPVAEAITESVVPAGERLIESAEQSPPVDGVLSDPDVRNDVPPLLEQIEQRPQQEIVDELVESESRDGDRAVDPSLFTFSRILKHRKMNKCLPARKYKVLWDGYSIEKASWINEEHFVDEDAREMLKAYKGQKNLIDFQSRPYEYSITSPPVLEERETHRRREVASPLPPPAPESSIRGRKSTRTVRPDDD